MGKEPWAKDIAIPDKDGQYPFRFYERKLPGVRYSDVPVFLAALFSMVVLGGCTTGRVDNSVTRSPLDLLPRDSVDTVPHDPIATAKPAERIVDEAAWTRNCLTHGASNEKSDCTPRKPLD